MITLLFITIEIIPSFFKLVMSHGLYDKLCREDDELKYKLIAAENESMIQIIESIKNGDFTKPIKKEETTHKEIEQEEAKPKETKIETPKPEESKPEESKQEEVKIKKPKPLETKQEENKQQHVTQHQKHNIQKQNIQKTQKSLPIRVMYSDNNIAYKYGRTIDINNFI